MSCVVVGVANRKKRLAELWQKLEKGIAPGKFGCVQVKELWGTAEERHYRPGHHWVFEFGDAGDKSCIEKKFEGLAHRSFEVYKGLRFYNGEQALTVKRWLHRIDADSSGLTFEAWDPSQDDLDPNVQPAFMMVNSSEVRGVATLDRGASAELQEIPPPALQGVAPTGRQTRSAGVRALNPALGPGTYALRVDVDNTWRERCE